MNKCIVIFAITSMLVTGCATKANYQEAFADKEAISGSSQVIAAPADVIFDAALEVTSQQGFNVDAVDPKGRVLAVTKEIQNNEDQEISHTIKSTVTVIPVSEQQARVMLSANQITELHKKSTVWFHLLWVLPLFPYDTEYTTVVTDRGTVHEPEFYTSFFSKLNQSVAAKNEKLAKDKAKAESDVALARGKEQEIAIAALFQANAEAEAQALNEQQVAALAEEEARAKKTKKRAVRSKK
ncbi:MAG: hypothetical protein WCP66_08715 [Methylococcales bacterium]